MIYCPSCGTANREGSRFCNECGESLSQARGIHCPRCGAIHTRASGYCLECGARLAVSDAAAESDEMPSGPDESASRPSGAPPPLPDELWGGVQTEGPDAVEVPEWLQALREGSWTAHEEHEAGLSGTLVGDEERGEEEEEEEEEEEGFAAEMDAWLEGPRHPAGAEEIEEVATGWVDLSQPGAEEPEGREPSDEGAPPEETLDDTLGWLSSLEPRPPAADEPETRAAPEQVAPWSLAGEGVSEELTEEELEEEGVIGKSLDEGSPGDLPEETVLDGGPADVVSEVGVEESDLEVRGTEETWEVPSWLIEKPGLPEEEPAPYALETSGEPEAAPAAEAYDDGLVAGPPTVSPAFPSEEVAVELPDWLRERKEGDQGADAEEEPGIVEEQGAAVDGSQEAVPPSARAPAKLERPESPSGVAPEAPGETGAGGEISGLVRAQIPAWLIAAHASDAAARSGGQLEAAPERGAGGALGDVAGIPPLEESLIVPPAPERAGSLLTSRPEIPDGTHLFQQVIAAEEPAPSLPATRARRGKFGPAILGLLLLAVICVPLITELRLFYPENEGGQAPAGVVHVRDTLDGLAPGQTVLIAFDFDPATVGEMEPIARALVGHVMRRRAHIVAVSILPAGPALAQRILDEEAHAADAYVYGEQYVNLGYLAGKEAGLRSLLTEPVGARRVDYSSGQSIAGQVVLSGLSSLEDFAYVIELAPDPQSARWWIEQVGSQVDVPIIVGASAAAEPYLRPYSEGQQPQIEALVAGLAGAADFEALVAGTSRRSDDVEALSWALTLAVLIILVAVGVSPLVGRERGR